MAKVQKKKNNHKKREPVNNKQPYDSKVFEICETCDDKMFYRRRKLFNDTIYFLLCNECGDFKTISKEEYLEKVSEATQTK